MSTASGTVECPPPISFNLNIKNTVEPAPIKTFQVRASRGQTLLEAMGENQNSDFSFQYQSVPTSGPYVVGVNGENSGPDKFWETLLYNKESKEVRPIILSYNVCPDDNIYLRFSSF